MTDKAPRQPWLAQAGIVCLLAAYACFAWPGVTRESLLDALDEPRAD